MTADPNRKLKVFLCHSSHDKPAVREIYARLKAEGWIDPWLDDEKLFPGQDWDLEIEKAVEETDAVLVFLSDNSVNKEGYIQRELRFILNMAEYKPEGTLFILPMRLNECPLPRRLRSWHYVNNFPEERKEWAYGRLLGSLKMRAKKLEIDVAAILKEKAEQGKKELTEKKRKEQAEKERKEKAVREAAKKAEQERIAKEKRDAGEKARLEKEAEEERERKAAAEKARQDKIDREKRKAEEKARQDGLRKERQQERKDNFKKFFSKNGKRFSLIGGGVIVLFVLAYIISNIEVPAEPKFTKTPTTSILATSTLKLPTLTPFPTSTLSPTKPSTPITIPVTPTPELGVGSTMVSEKDGMTMVYVPAGEFQMGSEDGDSDESPIHTVYLDAYWIDQTEVTNAMYVKCVADGVCDEPSSSKSYTRESYYGNAEFDNYPVIYVSWGDANNYCAWAERRLPTEAEWEKAAGWDESVKRQRVYPWGDVLDRNYANYGSLVGDTTVVGSYEGGKSFYGAYDMSGNVWEWVDNWYDVYPGGDVNVSDYFGEQVKVLRGGAWSFSDAGRLIRTTMRSSWRSSLSDMDNDIGFRCAMDAD